MTNNFILSNHVVSNFHFYYKHRSSTLEKLVRNEEEQFSAKTIPQKPTNTSRYTYHLVTLQELPLPKTTANPTNCWCPLLHFIPTPKRDIQFVSDSEPRRRFISPGSGESAKRVGMVMMKLPYEERMQCVPV